MKGRSPPLSFLWKTRRRRGLGGHSFGADTFRTSRAAGFSHPKGRSGAEDGAAVDGFPPLDTIWDGLEVFP